MGEWCSAPRSEVFVKRQESSGRMFRRRLRLQAEHRGPPLAPFASFVASLLEQLSSMSHVRIRRILDLDPRCLHAIVRGPAWAAGEHRFSNMDIPDRNGASARLDRSERIVHAITV